MEAIQMAGPLHRLVAWTAATGPRTRQAAQPVGGPRPGTEYEDPAFASFFAEYRQGRYEIPAEDYLAYG